MVRVHLQAQSEFWYSWCVRWSEKPEECDSISTDSTIDFVAQLVELFTFNEEVPRSSRGGITTHGYGATAAYGSPKPSMGVRISLPVLKVKIMKKQFDMH